MKLKHKMPHLHLANNGLITVGRVVAPMIPESFGPGPSAVYEKVSLPSLKM